LVNKINIPQILTIFQLPLNYGKGESVKVIYAWVAILVIIIAIVGIFALQLLTVPRLSNKAELPRMRMSLAEKYEQRANELSDSAMSMANRIKTIQGKLTSDQERRINRLLDRAKELKANAERMKNKTIKDNEASILLQSCYAVYGEANGICRQLQAGATKKTK
jgi:gas vesicle protein